MRKIKSIVGNMVYFSDIKDNVYLDYTVNQIVGDNIAKYVVDRKLSISEYGEEILLSDIVKMKADDIINLSLNIKGNPKFNRIVQKMVGDCNGFVNNFANQR